VFPTDLNEPKSSIGCGAAWPLVCTLQLNMLRPQMIPKPISVFVMLFLLVGCTERFATAPDLELARRTVPPSSVPVLVSIEDDQANERPKDYSQQLLKQLCDAYSGALEASPATSTIAPGRVSVTIRIHQLGAVFNRTKSSVLAVSPSLDQPRGTFGDWTDVISASRRLEPVASGTVFAHLPGNWSGITYLDVEVHDQRAGHAADFTMPLVAERSRPNKWGYFEAQGVAADAWDAVRPRLIAFIDAMVSKLGREQPS
jgi:hypothetical protein